jgi:hypothetical protein
MRNILEPAKITRKAARAIESVLSTPPKPWVATDGKIKKTARFAANDWDIGGGDSEPAAEGGGEGSAAPAKSPLDALEESVYQSILDKVKGKIEAELSAEKAVSGPTPEQSTAAPNDNIVKQAYSRKLALLLKNSKDSLDFIIRLAAYNERLGIRLPTSTYRIAAVVGVPRKKETLVGFVQRCNKAASHVLSIKELKQIVRIAKLLSIKKTVL